MANTDMILSLTQYIFAPQNFTESYFNGSRRLDFSHEAVSLASQIVSLPKKPGGRRQIVSLAAYSPCIFTMHSFPRRELRTPSRVLSPQYEVVLTELQSMAVKLRGFKRTNQ